MGTIKQINPQNIRTILDGLQFSDKSDKIYMHPKTGANQYQVQNAIDALESIIEFVMDHNRSSTPNLVGADEKRIGFLDMTSAPDVSTSYHAGNENSEEIIRQIKEIVIREEKAAEARIINKAFALITNPENGSTYFWAKPGASSGDILAAIPVLNKYFKGNFTSTQAGLTPELIARRNPYVFSQEDVQNAYETMALAEIKNYEITAPDIPLNEQEIEIEPLNTSLEIGEFITQMEEFEAQYADKTLFEMEQIYRKYQEEHDIEIDINHKNWGTDMTPQEAAIATKLENLYQEAYETLGKVFKVRQLISKETGKTKPCLVVRQGVGANEVNNAVSFLNMIVAIKTQSDVDNTRIKLTNLKASEVYYGADQKTSQVLQTVSDLIEKAQEIRAQEIRAQENEEKRKKEEKQQESATQTTRQRDGAKYTFDEETKFITSASFDDALKQKLLLAQQAITVFDVIDGELKEKDGADSQKVSDIQKELTENKIQTKELGILMGALTYVRTQFERGLMKTQSVFEKIINTYTNIHQKQANTNTEEVKGKEAAIPTEHVQQQESASQTTRQRDGAKYTFDEETKFITSASFDDALKQKLLLAQQAITVFDVIDGELKEKDGADSQKVSDIKKELTEDKIQPDELHHLMGALAYIRTQFERGLTKSQYTFEKIFDVYCKTNTIQEVPQSKNETSVTQSEQSQQGTQPVHTAEQVSQPKTISGVNISFDSSDVSIGTNGVFVFNNQKKNTPATIQTGTLLKIFRDLDKKGSGVKTPITNNENTNDTNNPEELTQLQRSWMNPER